MKTTLAEIRRAVAAYIKSEGCGCCRNREKHEQAADRLGKLLRVPKYSDGSGWDYSEFEAKPKETT